MNYNIQLDLIQDSLNFIYSFNHDKSISDSKKILAIQKEWPDKENYIEHIKYHKSLSSTNKAAIDLYERSSMLIFDAENDILPSTKIALNCLEAYSELFPTKLREELDKLDLRKIMNIDIKNPDMTLASVDKIYKLSIKVIKEIRKIPTQIGKIIDGAPPIRAKWLYRGVESKMFYNVTYDTKRMKSIVGSVIHFNRLTSFSISPSAAYSFTHFGHCCMFQLEVTPELHGLFIGAFTKVYPHEMEVLVSHFKAKIVNEFIYSDKESSDTGTFGVRVFVLRAISLV